MTKIFESLAIKVKNKEIKQTEIAINLGISSGYISGLLSGKYEPSETVTKLAEIIYGDKMLEHPNPRIQAIIKMVEEMDKDTQQSALDSIEKEKWIAELKKERQEKKAA